MNLSLKISRSGISIFFRLKSSRVGLACRLIRPAFPKILASSALILPGVPYLANAALGEESSYFFLRLPMYAAVVPVLRLPLAELVLSLSESEETDDSSELELGEL